MRRFLATLISLMLLAGPTLQGATPPRLTARLPASIPALSPVEAELTVENTGSGPVLLQDFPRVRLFRVEILDAANNEVIHRGFVSPMTGPLGESYLKPVSLAAGGSYPVPVTLANRWSENKTLVGPAFPAPGRYLLSFSYVVTWETGGTSEVSEIRSPEVPLEVVAPAGAQQAAFERLRTLPHLSWSLEPRSGLRAGSEPDLAVWEREMREHLRDFPQSPWAAVLQYSLALRLYDKSFRPGHASPALLDEASRLTTTALSKDGFPYRRDATELRQRLDKSPVGAVLPAAAPPEAQAVESEFSRLVQRLGEGDTDGLRALLHPDFKYNARLNAADWLLEITAEYRALAPAKLSVTAKTISVASNSQGTVLVTDVTYEAGLRKSQRRVQATYREHGGAWRLADWTDLTVQ